MIKSDTYPILGTLAGAVFIAFAPILVKAVTLGPTAVGFYRVGIGALVLLPLWTLFRSKLGMASGITLAQLLPAVAAGIFFAADLFLWHRSIHYIGSGLATILANTQVAFVLLVELLFLRLPFSGKRASAILISFAGVIVLISPSIQGWDENYVIGVTFGVGTGLVYTGFILSLQKAGRAGANAIQSLGIASLVAAILLLCSALIEGVTLIPPTLTELGYLTILGAVVHVGGWYLISTNLVRLRASQTGLLLLIQPTLATFLGILIYNESIGPIQALGAIAVLIGIYIGAIGRTPVTSKP